MVLKDNPKKTLLVKAKTEKKHINVKIFKI